MTARFSKGMVVKMTPDAVENYGAEWEGKPLVIDAVATKWMPSNMFYAKGRPDGYHPGYDGNGEGLYNLSTLGGVELPFSLYDWELTA